MKLAKPINQAQFYTLFCEKSIYGAIIIHFETIKTIVSYFSVELLELRNPLLVSLQHLHYYSN